jgi:lipopolysaccharide transport system ATP-binding protein
MITGVVTPSSGTIEVHGKITAMLELGAGFNPELTGMENLYMSGAISGFSKEEMEAKIADIVAFADIGEFIHQPLKTYSSGMKARLGFAFAIHSEPEILIIDEALSVGDVAFQRKCYSRIEDTCKDEGITVLFVSHSESVIVNLCNRALLLYGGELLLDGKPKDVVTQYLKISKSNQINKDQIKKDFIESSQQTFKESKDCSIFSNDLLSQSTVELEKNGGFIYNILLLNSKNEKVNVLDYNRVYTFRYTVEFLEDVRNVSFGVFTKTKDGISLGGREKKSTKQLYKKGEIVVIEWQFKTIFANGYYLINCGVISNEYERRVIHRVFDAYLFQVRGVQDEDFTGHINLNLDYTEINDA